MLFTWTFPAIFILLTILFLLGDAWARSRSSGPPTPTRWWLVFAVITTLSFFIAVLIEVIATVAVVLITGSLLLSI